MLMYQRVTPSQKYGRSVSVIGLARGTPSYAWKVQRSRRGGLSHIPAVYGDATTLGFSLNPLSLIKSGLTAVKKIFSNSTVTLPTSSGPVTVKGGDLGTVVRGASFNVAGTQPPTAMERISSGVEAIPGGWMTLAGVGIGAIVLTTVLSRRR
jgi:hypothetical protein